MTRRQRLSRELSLYSMILLPLLLVAIYNYGPMFGLAMAFQRFEPLLGFFRSPWVGLANFRRLFGQPDIWQVTFNTLYIAVLKIVVETSAAISVAILLNEIIQSSLKRVIQTVIYFPNFLSWVILGGIMRDTLARDGIVNVFLSRLGFEPIIFLAEPALFPWVLVLSETWKTTGYGAIIFLAAICSINPQIYEAAAIDGAGWVRKTIHVTLSGMQPTILLMLTLSMGWILNAGFDQILMLYSPVVYSTGDVIDTWIYRTGFVYAQYSLSTAVGLLRSGVSLILVAGSYYLAHRFADYRIF